MRTIVLPDDATRPGSTGRLPPASLHVPEVLQPQVQSLNGTSVEVTVQFPSMQPWSQVPHCRFGFCNNELTLTISRGAGSLAAVETSQYRRLGVSNAQALAAVPGGITALTRQPTMPGYDTSWAFGTSPGDDRISRTVHARDARENMPAELAECDVSDHRPTCDIMTDLGDGLQLRLRFSADLWAERDAVRTAATQLAQSFVTDKRSR